MKDFIPKFKNWWWYNKLWLLIGAAAVGVLVYCFVPSKNQENPDYYVAVVTDMPLRDEEKAELEAFFTANGRDVNGDGEILVRLNLYPVDLADKSPNAGSNNYQTVAALDADLVGKVSGLFILESPEVFRQVTDNILSEETGALDERLSIALRADAADEYTELFEKLTK